MAPVAPLFFFILNCLKCLFTAISSQRQSAADSSRLPTVAIICKASAPPHGDLCLELILFVLICWCVVLTVIGVMARFGFSPLTSGVINGAFESLGKRFRQVSRKPHLCALFIIASVVVLRLAALPVYPMPLPGVHDELSYLLGADTFASGRWTNPSPKLWEFFETEHVLVRPTYSSKYPPGQAFTLALGQLIGHPWFGVLATFATMCGSIYWMARAFLPPQWALVAGLLPLVQPGISSYWCNSYWGGSLAATGTALVFGACKRVSVKISTYSLSFLAIGLVLIANSRPAEGLVSVSLIGLYSLYLIARKKKVLELLRHMLLPVLILAVCFSCTLYYNYKVTENALLMPHVLYHTQYERTPLVNGKPLYPEPIYHNEQVKDFWTKEDVSRWNDVQKPDKYLQMLKDEVILGYFSLYIGLWLAPMAMAWGLTLRDKRVRILWISWALVLAAIAVELKLHYFERHYLAPVMSLNYVLLTQGLRHLRFFKIKNLELGKAFVRATAIASAIGFVVGFLLLPKLRYDTQIAQATLSTPRAQFIDKLSALPGKHLIIVHYAINHDPGYEFVFNLADLENGKVVWARDLGERNKELLDHYRDRTVWVVDADSRPVKLYTLEESKAATLTKVSPDKLPF